MVFQAFILCELFHCCDFGGSSNNNLAGLPTKAHKSRLVICMINCGVMRCTVIPKGDFSEEYNFYILISIFKSSGNNVHKLTPTWSVGRNLPPPIGFFLLNINCLTHSKLAIAQNSTIDILLMTIRKFGSSVSKLPMLSFRFEMPSCNPFLPWLNSSLVKVSEIKRNGKICWKWRQKFNKTENSALSGLAWRRLKTKL